MEFRRPLHRIDRTFGLPIAAVVLGSKPPLFANLFTEMTIAPAGIRTLSWEPDDIGGFEIMRYDNNADPTVEKNGQIAWPRASGKPVSRSNSAS